MSIARIMWLFINGKDTFRQIFCYHIICYNLLFKEQILKNQLNFKEEKNLPYAQVSILMDAYGILSNICQWLLFIHRETAEDTVLIRSSLAAASPTPPWTTEATTARTFSKQQGMWRGLLWMPV